jgi:hypothetical protein
MGYLIFAIYSVFFLFFQTNTLYGGDGGDFVAAALSGGFAHAPGYPLYSILGYLLTKLPFETPAWRVSLLSSIPAALTLTVLYLLIKKQTSSKFAGIIASATLGLTYVFWLYSVVPEVFILAIFFSTSIFYLLYLWSEHGNNKLLYISIFLLGLSLAHHHIIAFMFPAYAFIVLKNKKLLPKKNASTIKWVVFSFGAGLLPYIWLPISTYFVAAHTWGDPDTFVKFMKVVTRAYYGTFIAAQNYNQSLTERLNQIPILYNFYIEDFLIPTVAIAMAGAYDMYKKNKKLFAYTGLAFLFTGPLFFAYASYQHATPYEEAVAERFLLPSYVMVAIYFGYGIQFLHEVLNKIFTKNVRKEIVLLLMSALILIPLRLGMYNYYKIGVLKTDLTAEHFAEDILNTATKGKSAIFLLQNDNTVFNTQYLYQWKKDVYHNRIPLNPAELTNGFSNKIIKKHYPKMVLPSDTRLHPVADFIKKNYDSFEIYTDLPEDYKKLEGIKTGTWVPYGLIYRYYKREDLPDPKIIVQRNAELWDMYHNPLDESLGFYKNLQLEHVLEFYQFGEVRSGVFALESNDGEHALKHLDAYSKLKPSATMKLAQVSGAAAYIALRRCDKAEPIVKSIHNYETDSYYKLMIDYYNLCKKDEKLTNLWKKKFVDFEKRKEQVLQKL